MGIHPKHMRSEEIKKRSEKKEDREEKRGGGGLVRGFSPQPIVGRLKSIYEASVSFLML